MSRREDAKEFNRARIRAAAEHIIREEGLQNLSMRRLAQEADVSLRTPYNLFGSKTDVLISLMEQARVGFVPETGAVEQHIFLERWLTTLDSIEAFFGADEEYFRAIYAAIMTSDHPEARASAFSRNVEIARDRLEQAAENGELLVGTDTDQLGRRLAIHLIGSLGMWGAGMLSIRECIAQVREDWYLSLIQQSSDQVRVLLVDAMHAQATSAAETASPPETERG